VGTVVGAVVPVGLVVGTPVGEVVGAEVGTGVVVDAGGVTLQPAAPPVGAPAFSQVVNVASSDAARRAFGGGGIGFVSLAMRSSARLATVRAGLLFAAA
jgi:hypothetical protein